MEWSHLPVCHPISLFTFQHWTITKYARDVTCTGQLLCVRIIFQAKKIHNFIALMMLKVGDYQSTKCRLNCAHNFVAVESEPYVCDKSPCPRWTLGQSHCYYCNTNCSKLHDLELPKPASMVPALGCKCPMIVVASDPRPEGDKRKRVFGRPSQGIKVRAKSTGI